MHNRPLHPSYFCYNSNDRQVAIFRNHFVFDISPSVQGNKLQTKRLSYRTMSKKRNKSVKPKLRRRKTYAQKHPCAKNRISISPEKEPEIERVVLIVVIIIFLLATLVFLITGGTPGYDWYPNRGRYR